MSLYFSVFYKGRDVSKFYYNYLLVFFLFTPLLTLANNSFFMEFDYDDDDPSQIIKIKNILEVCKSNYQTISIYETEHFGKMMVIDGFVMLTQHDNFSYHEMLVHVPMHAHPNPEKVLIVGGGDGGTLKEVLKHKTVKEVVLCELDEQVIAVSQKHFPEFKAGFYDPRVKIVIDDAAQYIKTKKDYFDVVCIDSTDPIGPATVLFEQEFFQDIKEALHEDGIAAAQMESMFYYADLVPNVQQFTKKLFKHVLYYYTLVPTYPSGTIGFLFFSKHYGPFECLDAKKIGIEGLHYYNNAIHRASFQLPQFFKDKLAKT